MRTNSITANHKGNCPEPPKVWKTGSGKEATKIPPHNVLLLLILSESGDRTIRTAVRGNS